MNLSPNRKKIGRYSVFTLFSFFVFVLLFFVFANQSVQQYAAKYIVDDIDTLLTEPADAVVILGSQVYADGRLSRAVQDRADAAMAFWRAGQVRKIIISGDNRTRRYDEVTAIKKYLFAQGIPASEVFLDYAGLDTYDSVYRAQYIFGVKSLIIPTQQFHVARAVYLARKLGIEARSIAIDKHELPSAQRLALREFFARGKAWIEIFFGSAPHHLGEKIPLDGQSNSEG